MRGFNYRKFVILLLAGSATLAASAIAPGQIRFKNEAADTTFITNMLIEAAKISTRNPQDRVAEIALKFVGTPYQEATLEGDPETLTINTSELDCTTYVETVLAMAKTVGERRTSWRDYAYNLEQMRYRNGNPNGYASRLHYISDWIVDNTHRGNIEEVTTRIGRTDSQIKTLDYMTSHRDKYPALADSAEYERMKNAEIGYRSHKYHYIKGINVNGADLKDGDVVALITRTPGLDVSHMGFIVMKGKVPYLLHASSKAGKVVIDEISLADYIRRSKNVTGIRVIRLKD